MTITFKNNNDVIVYPLEKVISHARDNQYIFLAQSVWWISSILGLQQELITHIDTLKIRSGIQITRETLTSAENQESLDILREESVANTDTDRRIHPSRIGRILESDHSYINSGNKSSSTSETDIHNAILDNCETALQQSEQERKAIGRKNRQVSKVVKRKANKKKPIKTFGTQTEGIDGSELRRRKAAGECQRCAWPTDRKGSHKTLDCFRWKRVEKGTAPLPKNTRYKKN
jgi:hypothetical protein